MSRQRNVELIYLYCKPNTTFKDDPALPVPLAVQSDAIKDKT